MTEEWHVPGWVGPVAGITAASPQYISYRQLTEQLSSRINSIQSTIKHHQLAAASKGAGAQDTSVSAKASKRKQKQRHHQVRQQDSALLALQEHQSQLTAARKALSHELLLHIQDSYCTQDIKGRHLHLLEVYESYCHLSGEEPNHLIYAGASPRCKPAGAKGREWQSQQQHLLAKQQQHADSAASASAARKVVSFPAGTGDCCAPKLIHAAMQARLTPVGLVEFWYGAPPGEHWAASWVAAVAWHECTHCISAACCAGVRRATAHTLAVWVLSIHALHVWHVGHHLAAMQAEGLGLTLPLVCMLSCLTHGPRVKLLSCTMMHATLRSLRDEPWSARPPLSCVAVQALRPSLRQAGSCRSFWRVPAECTSSATLCAASVAPYWAPCCVGWRRRRRRRGVSTVARVARLYSHLHIPCQGSLFVPSSIAQRSMSDCMIIYSAQMSKMSSTGDVVRCRCPSRACILCKLFNSSRWIH